MTEQSSPVQERGESPMKWIIPEKNRWDESRADETLLTGMASEAAGEVATEGRARGTTGSECGSKHGVRTDAEPAQQATSDVKSKVRMQRQTIRQRSDRGGQEWKESRC